MHEKAAILQSGFEERLLGEPALGKGAGTVKAREGLKKQRAREGVEIQRAREGVENQRAKEGGKPQKRLDAAEWPEGTPGHPALTIV